MAEFCARLSESIYSDDKPISSTDLLQRLRFSPDSIRPGLENLLPILKRGVEAARDGKLGLQSWANSQIQVVYSISYVVASSSRSLSVKQANAVIVAIVQQSLEFAVCYLERSEFSREVMSIQNNMVQLLEMALLSFSGYFFFTLWFRRGSSLSLNPRVLTAIMLTATKKNCGNSIANNYSGEVGTPSVPPPRHLLQLFHSSLE